VIVDSVAQVTFSAPVFVPLTSTGEAALSGAVAATAQGKFASAPVKGEGGVFLFQVEKKALRQGVKFDDKQQEAKLRQSYARRIMMQELYLKANVKDNRYLFF
jgi:peptidyl-prolyl cis-trans isomerase D